MTRRDTGRVETRDARRPHDATRATNDRDARAMGDGDAIVARVHVDARRRARSTATNDAIEAAVRTFVLERKACVDDARVRAVRGRAGGGDRGRRRDRDVHGVEPAVCGF